MTSPVKVLVAVLASVRVPESDVVPVTVRVQVLVVPVAKVVPDPTARFPEIVKAAPVVAKAVRFKDKFTANRNSRSHGFGTGT